jgi:hypothetical protein
VKVSGEAPWGGCLEHRRKRGAADPRSPGGGTQFGDGPSGDCDRELLACFSAAKYVANVITQLLLGNCHHATEGSRSATAKWKYPSETKRVPKRVPNSAIMRAVEVI